MTDLNYCAYVSYLPTQSKKKKKKEAHLIASSTGLIQSSHDNDSATF